MSWPHGNRTHSLIDYEQFCGVGPTQKPLVHVEEVDVEDVDEAIKAMAESNAVAVIAAAAVEI